MDVNEQLDDAGRWPRNTVISVSAIWQLVIGAIAIASATIGLNTILDDKVVLLRSEVRERYVTQVDHTKALGEIKLELSKINQNLAYIKERIENGLAH